MIIKILISTLVLFGGTNMARANDNSLIRMVCFDVWSDTLNRKGKVFVIDFKTTNPEAFFSGEDESQIAAKVTVFRNVEHVKYVNHLTDVNKDDKDVLKFSNSLFSTHDDNDDNDDDQGKYDVGTAQSGLDDDEIVEIVFTWNNKADQTVGAIGIGKGETSRGSLSENYGPQNSNNDSGRVMCLEPVTVQPEGEKVAIVKEETLLNGANSSRIYR